MVAASSESQPVEIPCLSLENVEQEPSFGELIKNRGTGVLPLENAEQELFSNAIDNGQIPQIVIYHSNAPVDYMFQFGQNDTEENEPEVTVAAEPPAEKKGAMCALRRYSKALMRSPNLKSSERLTLFGEDPTRGVTGPGQMRKGSYQGQEIGYLRIGLSAIRGTLEVEIIRGIILLIPGDHPPDTYVKTYLIKEHIRLLKRKTSITRQSINPVYNCKIKYPGNDLHNKELLVSIWCKHGIFGRKVLLGEVRIALGSLNLSVKQVSWYNLFIDSQLSE